MGALDISNSLSTFDFGGIAIRVLSRADGPWFVAADACAAINLRDVSDAVSKLDDDEKGRGSIPTPGGNQDLLIVSESGLYTIILRCRGATRPGTLPHRFRRWVTSDVLPQIRRVGSYGAPAPVDPRQFLADPRNMLALLGDYARALDEERDAHCLTQEHLGQTSKALTIQTLRNNDLSQDLGAAQAKVQAIQPKALALDRMASTSGSSLISDVAKDLGMAPGRLFAFLDTQSTDPTSPHWIYRRKEGGDWICAQRAIDLGLVDPVIEEVALPDGRTVTRRQARITDKGQARLAVLLSNGKIQPALDLQSRGPGPNPGPHPPELNATETRFASMTDDKSLIDMDVAARREANRERRIAAARTAEKESALAAATARRPGNGAPLDLSPAREVCVIGELLYGKRWQAEVARDVGENVRQVRRWVSGQATPPANQVANLRRAARTRAKAILSLVGDGL